MIYFGIALDIKALLLCSNNDSYLVRWNATVSAASKASLIYPNVHALETVLI